MQTQELVYRLVEPYLKGTGRPVSISEELARELEPKLLLLGCEKDDFGMYFIPENQTDIILAFYKDSWRLYPPWSYVKRE